MNKIYKILENASNKEKIKSGDIIDIKVDLALAHDGSMPKIIDEIEKNEGKIPIPYGQSLHVTVDHFLPWPTVEARESFLRIKEFSKENNINLYDQGEGILHQVIGEKFGHELKDKILVGVDGHMSTNAGMGALTFSITPREMVQVLYTGKYTLTVPEYINLNLIGKLAENPSIAGKDIGLYMISNLGVSLIKNKAILITGDILEELTNSQKMTIGNMLGEVGARTVYFNGTKGEENSYSINISQIGSLVITPNIEEIMNVKDIEEIKVTQVFIGGCTNGRIDDIKEVVKVLKDKKINPNVNLVVGPASKKVANEMDELGYSRIIRDSGGIVINPGCGPCSGIHQGVISKDDIMVTTTPRNSPGRMGDREGQIFITSPKIAAIAALQGFIGKGK